MNLKKEAILNPEKALEEIKPKLFEIYKRDYHQKDFKEIEKRWENTIFIMDSLPREERDFIKKYGTAGYSKKRLLQVEAEYWNYQKEEKKIEKDTLREFKDYLTRNHKVPEDCDATSLWNLDFESILEEDHTRLRNYTLACLNLGMDPIASWEEIANIVRKKEELKEKRDIRKIEETRWGRRMQEKYPMFSSSILANIFFDETTSASTSLTRCEDGSVKTVCFIPLIRHVKIPSLDRMVLHELRHVVETTEDKTGLTIFRIPRFDMINELRTERNAMLDCKDLPIIFGRNSDQIQSHYELLLPAVPKINDLEDVFNIASFAEDYGVIEGVLEKDLVALTDIIDKEEKVIQKIRKG